MMPFLPSRLVFFIVLRFWRKAGISSASAAKSLHPPALLARFFGFMIIEGAEKGPCHRYFICTRRFGARYTGAAFLRSELQLIRVSENFIIRNGIKGYIIRKR
jgi:hypothetical protein